MPDGENLARYEPDAEKTGIGAPPVEPVSEEPVAEPAEEVPPVEEETPSEPAEPAAEGEGSGE